MVEGKQGESHIRKACKASVQEEGRGPPWATAAARGRVQ